MRLRVHNTDRKGNLENSNGQEQRAGHSASGKHRNAVNTLFPANNGLNGQNRGKRDGFEEGFQRNTPRLSSSGGATEREFIHTSGYIENIEYVPFQNDGTLWIPENETATFTSGNATQYMNLGVHGNFAPSQPFYPDYQAPTSVIGGFQANGSETVNSSGQNGQSSSQNPRKVSFSSSNETRTFDLSQVLQPRTGPASSFGNGDFSLQERVRQTTSLQLQPTMQSLPSEPPLGPEIGGFLSEENGNSFHQPPLTEQDFVSFMEYLNSSFSQDDVFTFLNSNSSSQDNGNRVVDTPVLDVGPQNHRTNQMPVITRADWEIQNSLLGLPNTSSDSQTRVGATQNGASISQISPAASRSGSFGSRNGSFVAQNGSSLTDNGSHAGNFAANIDTNDPHNGTNNSKNSALFFQTPTPVSPNDSVHHRKDSRLLSTGSLAPQVDISYNSLFSSDIRNTAVFEDDMETDPATLRTLESSSNSLSALSFTPRRERGSPGEANGLEVLPPALSACSGPHPKKRPCVDCFTPTDIGRAIGLTVEASNVQCLTVVVNYHGYVGTITNAGLINERLVNTMANPSKEDPVALISTKQDGILEVSTVLQRRRYTRNIDELFGSVANMTYVASRSFRPNNPYEPQYYRFEVFDGKLMNKSKCGLCPYCEAVRFLPFKNSTYLSHLTLEHGVFANNFLIPEGLNYGLYDNAANGRRVRAVQCAVCLKVVETGCWSIKANPLLSYFRHFKKKHSSLTWDFTDCVFAPILARGRGLKEM